MNSEENRRKNFGFEFKWQKRKIKNYQKHLPTGTADWRRLYTQTFSIKQKAKHV